jgi:hypothetical protein
MYAGEHIMAVNKDWYPKTREGILSMARDWVSAAGASASAWGIPPNVLQELNTLLQTADTALVTAKNETARDPAPTPGGIPTAQVTVETYLAAGQGNAPPAGPDDLHKSFFTKRKKDVIEFDFGDSGKTAYFAVQIENDGKKGALVSALIP